MTPRPSVVRAVCESLHQEYGQPRLGNPRDPLDDLVYIMVSNRTGPEVARQTYKRLKEAFSSWDSLLDGPSRTLAALLKPAGLSRIKSRQIRAAMQLIRRDFGSCDLRQLRRFPEAEAERYLASLPGASTKVAKCVAMYTLGGQVLPVDVHVHRISTRLGWTRRKRADQCHRELEAIVAPHLRHSFHVDCIQHGRSVCLPKNPNCAACCIRRYCQYYKAMRAE